MRRYGPRPVRGGDRNPAEDRTDKITRIVNQGGSNTRRKISHQQQFCPVILTVAVRAATGLKLPAPADFVTHLLLCLNLAPGGTMYGINAVFWTLAIEAQFYLLLPVMVWAGRRLAGGGTAGIAVAAGPLSRLVEGGAWPTLYGADADVKYRWPSSYLDLFGAGMLAAAAARPVGRVFGRAVGRAGAGLVFAAGVGLVLVAGWWSSVADIRAW